MSLILLRTALVFGLGAVLGIGIGKAAKGSATPAVPSIYGYLINLDSRVILAAEVDGVAPATLPSELPLTAEALAELSGGRFAVASVGGQRVLSVALLPQPQDGPLHRLIISTTATLDAIELLRHAHDMAKRLGRAIVPGVYQDAIDHVCAEAEATAKARAA